MSKAIILQRDHTIIIEEIVKEFGITKERAITWLLEGAIIMKRVLSESDEEILKHCHGLQKSDPNLQLIKLVKAKWGEPVFNTTYLETIKIDI